MLKWALSLQPKPKHRLTVEEAERLQQRRLLAAKGIQVIGRM